MPIFQAETLTPVRNARFTKKKGTWMIRSKKCTGKLKEVKLTVIAFLVLSR